MTHYNTNYSSIPDRTKKDEKAIQDIFDYIGSNQEFRDILMVELGKCAERGTAKAFAQMNFTLSFAGISGYPVHALGRKYCLESYRAWMHDTTDGNEAVLTDEQGFPIKEGE